MMDVHKFGKRMETYPEWAETSGQKEAITGFLKELETQGLSKGRILKYAFHSRVLASLSNNLTSPHSPDRSCRFGQFATWSFTSAIRGFCPHTSVQSRPKRPLSPLSRLFWKTEPLEHLLRIHVQKPAHRGRHLPGLLQTNCLADVSGFLARPAGFENKRPKTPDRALTLSIRTALPDGKLTFFLMVFAKTERERISFFML